MSNIFLPTSSQTFSPEQFTETFVTEPVHVTKFKKGKLESLMKFDKKTEETQTYLCRTAMSRLAGSLNEKVEERKG